MKKEDTTLETFLKWAKVGNKNNDRIFKIRKTNKMILIEKMPKEKSKTKQ